MPDLKSLCVSSLWRCAGRTLAGEEEKEAEGEPRRRRTVTGQEGAEAGTQSSVSNSSAGRRTEVEGRLKKKKKKGGWRSAIEAASEGAGAPSAAVRPYSINMELENIVANTVLLKAREGEDGDGGADSFCPPWQLLSAAVEWCAPSEQITPFVSPLSRLNVPFGRRISPTNLRLSGDAKLA